MALLCRQIRISRMMIRVLWISSLFQEMGKTIVFRSVVFFVLIAFTFSLISPRIVVAQALEKTGSGFVLWPSPGTMITPTSPYVPPILKGMQVDLKNPFSFNFLLDTGNASLNAEGLKRHAGRLIKYFLVSLTIPEDDLWVNLSPYEKDRIIAEEFGITEMGRDLLAQDYVLKQLTASLIYPEEELGENFWNNVYAKSRELYGKETIPVNTFNKVWILPDKAVVYQNQGVVFILESHLKVMLEEDYQAFKSSSDEESGRNRLQQPENQELNNVSSQIIREVVIPEIEREVNEGQSFSKLRQAYHSLILAKWYKQNLKNSVLNREYTDQKKIEGVDVGDRAIKEKIYRQYLDAFKKGVFNYIKEDYDSSTQQIVSRKYFSGGLALRVSLEQKTGLLNKAELAKVGQDKIGTLHWIKGIYIQPGKVSGLLKTWISQVLLLSELLRRFHIKGIGLYSVKGVPSPAGGVYADVDMAQLVDLDNVPIRILQNTTGILSAVFNRMISGPKDYQRKARSRRHIAETLRILVDGGFVEPEMIRLSKDSLGIVMEGLQKKDFYVQLDSIETLSILKEAKLIDPGSIDIPDNFWNALVGGLSKTRQERLDSMEVLRSAIKGKFMREEVARRVVDASISILSAGMNDFDMLLSVAKLLRAIADGGLVGVENIRIPENFLRALIRKFGHIDSVNGLFIAQGLQILAEGGMIGAKNINISEDILTALLQKVGGRYLVQSLHYIEMLQALVKGKFVALGDIRIGRNAVEALIKGLDDEDMNMKLEIIKGLGILAEMKAIEPSQINIPAESLRVLTGKDEFSLPWNYRLRMKVLKALAEGGFIQPDHSFVPEKFLETLIARLKDNDSELRANAVKTLKILAEGKFIRWEEIDIPEGSLEAFIEGLTKEDPFKCFQSAEGLETLVRQKLIAPPGLAIDDIRQYYSLIRAERKTAIPEDQESIIRRVFIMKIISIVESRVDSEDAVYLGKMIANIRNMDLFKAVVEIMREWAAGGEVEAQHFLETNVSRIASRNPAEGRDYVDMDEKDHIYIDALAGSSRQRGLMPIFFESKFDPDTRGRVMRLLAKSDYIDSAYAKIGDDDIKSYLNLISYAYKEMEIRNPPYVLVDGLVKGEIDKEKINTSRLKVKDIVEKKDYRVLIQGLSDDEDLLFAYYMSYQSPFQYQGVEPMSYERFRALVQSSAESFSKENTDIVTKILKESFMAAGVDEERASQIAARLLKGGPPLPDDSPYLDKDGNFIPQMVDVLSQAGYSFYASMEAKKSFDSSVENTVLIFRINELMRRIPAAIARMTEKNASPSLEKEYQEIVEGITPGVDLRFVLKSLMDINDKIFPPEKRRNDFDKMVAASINKAIRNTPMQGDMINAKEGQASEENPKRIDLEGLDIEGLVRNSKKMVNILRTKKNQNKLSLIEKEIIGEDEVNMGHCIKIFFGNLAQGLKLDGENPLDPVLKDMEGHLATALENYKRAVSEKVDISNIPGVVYVDFVSKFNLFEFFRFADGAHCCLTSDPKVAHNHDHSDTLYSKHMPRYLTNATSFFWQFTTDFRSGRQIGWFENWFGVDEANERKVFVGSELMYLAPRFHDRDLQTALTSKIEEILFSTKVTKVAQASFGHHAANALSPPEGYVPQEMRFVKLQSLPGEPIYEDASVETNISVTQALEKDPKTEEVRGFYVRDNSGEVSDKIKVREERDNYNVSMEFIDPSKVDNELIKRLLFIEDLAFEGYTKEGENFMRRRIQNSKALIALFRDDETNEIVGYRYAIPADQEKQLLARDEKYRQKNVLYLVHVALLPKYWGKADMGKKFRTFFERAKELGYEYVTTHAVSGHGAGSETTLSEKYQSMGFEYHYTESPVTSWDEKYDFLVLDLSKMDSAMLMADDFWPQSDAMQSSVQQNPGGIDFNPDLLDLEVRGQDVNFNLAEVDPDSPQIHINGGLLPVILKITPADLSFILRGAVGGAQQMTVVQ